MKPIFFSAGFDAAMWGLLFDLRDAVLSNRGALALLRCVAGPEERRRPYDGGRTMDIRTGPEGADLCQ